MPVDPDPTPVGFVTTEFGIWDRRPDLFPAEDVELEDIEIEEVDPAVPDPDFGPDLWADVPDDPDPDHVGEDLGVEPPPGAA